ncbi:transposase [Streptomyces sp. NPDC056529]|uniref:transposase n=1 Tax=Streptomyces sp. NPDC056529 TaxID=3345855 RepID=UPI0036BF4E3A
MGRGDPTNAEWARLGPHLPASGRRGGRWNDRREVLNGILFRARTGIPWRDFPEPFGSWKTAHERHRHRRWSADGTWDWILRAVQAKADLAGRIDWSMASVDSTSCRDPSAHGRDPKEEAARPEPVKTTLPVRADADRRPSLSLLGSGATHRLWLRP